jgi:hypothetical protein
MGSRNLLFALILGVASVPISAARLENDVAVEGHAPKQSKPNFDEALNKIRMHRAEVIKQLGHDVDWTQYSSAELLDMELRIRAAQALKNLDYDAYWAQEPLDALLDKHARIEKARALEKMGVDVNWTKMTLDQLNDYVARIRKAEALKQLGKIVDWQKHTLKQLSAMHVQALQYRRAGR